MKKAERDAIRTIFPKHLNILVAVVPPGGSIAETTSLSAAKIHKLLDSYEKILEALEFYAEVTADSKNEVLGRKARETLNEVKE